MIDSPTADLFRRPVTKRVVVDLFAEARNEKDQHMRTVLLSSADKINDLNQKCLELSSVLVALVRQQGGQIIVTSQCVRQAKPEDTLIVSSDERTGILTLTVKGAGLIKV